ncbi:hypothetical protein FS749_003220 [Ceratobasidium sp. UAMH 11750]|nr:hypothetical protein FS749_003220 [Ceratobasidium sp. UAMH 11750]
MRKWMIKPEVMKKNEHWMQEGRVYDNGPEWGDKEPVLLGKSTSKRLKTEAPPDLLLAQQTQGDWLQAKEDVVKYMAARRTEDVHGLI